ncbi:receptor-type tyrosine-protein phosphatase H [Pseudorasbora parva]|uniref:receptor-type tyrosine-protein phosphatase H n=1 Tax=Pseudorasbora parva TaxID=51549 RepID=UPI00351EB1A9
MIMERVLTLGFLCALSSLGQMKPADVVNVLLINRTQTELTFQWGVVGNTSYNYTLVRDGVTNKLITVKDTETVVMHTVSSLSPGTNYSFTLYTEFKGDQSNGYNFSYATVPSNVESVSIIDRKETEMTLQWGKVNNRTDYTYELKFSDGENVPNTSNSSTPTLEGLKVMSLSPGTEYSFTLYTVFEGVKSSGYNFSNVTVPSNVESVSIIDRKETEMTLQWGKVNNRTDYTYELKFRDGEKFPNTSNSSTPTLEGLKVMSLSPGTEYSFTLYTVFEGVKSSGYNFSNVTVPSNVESVSVIDRKETEMTLQWGKVNNRTDYTYELKFRDGEKFPNTSNSSTRTLEGLKVMSLSPGTEYSFTLYTVFEGVKSSGYNFSNVTVPSKVENVIVVEHNDTDVILQWNVGNKSYSYSLEFSKITRESIITKGNESHISGLIPATNYSFTLYTEFFDVRSTGYNFNHTTTLSSVTEVRVTRSLTELTITWNKLNNNNIYNYTLHESQGSDTYLTASPLEDTVTHTYSSLTPGTVYSFTLFTVVNDVRNAGYSFKSVTTLNCVSFNWKVTNSSIEAQVHGSTHVTAQNSTSIGQNNTVVGNSVNLQGLYPGGSYNVSLWFHLESERFLQCSHLLTLVPNSVPQLYCEHFSGGYGLVVIWEHPYGVVDVVQVDIDGQSFNRSSSESQRQEVKKLQAAKWYDVTATSFSGAMTSTTNKISCQTDPAGVIAGVLVFFLLVIIICAAIFIWFRYGSAKRNKSSKGLVEPRGTKQNYRLIPVDKFPENFRNMSRDENRGFSEEYEDLSTVGIEQSRAAANLPENKDKNRFSNVLPYDVSRVHLTVNDEDDSDYINANYMPGYANASRQYIAAQGPLPSTVNDFWRMVWEKRSQAIVMVTNCTESGRIKCEQYWPLDYSPFLYGNLVVTMKSENKAHSWILRVFNVNNKSTSETRTVKHFHFTAWPDHGVPFGTEELIQFRGLIRQHIESTSSAGPTVVHCSAGVGRTGTLIALDILLQQLDREKAVGIAAVVQQMRLCRPLMVQTESQYVFLHQCIMDSLQPKAVDKSEPLYENTDMIYVNAIALKQYENGSNI